jgi:hypothetical protein
MPAVDLGAENHRPTASHPASGLHWADVGARVAGLPNSRSYFLAYQDPEELRATGGFIGSVGLVSVHNGITRQQFSSTGFDQENETVPTPQPMLIYNDEPAWYLRDANWSPNFPTTAAVERYLLLLDTHQRPQGVINITPAAAADVLKATGPIYSPEYKRWVTSANVAQLADFIPIGRSTMARSRARVTPRASSLYRSWHITS